MKILVVGNGGREHALAWKALQGQGVTDVLVAPGNAGTAREPGLTNVDVAVDDFPGLTGLAEREGVDLTIVGPEAPLVAGICDHFDSAGLACFGPSRGAAQLEGSKSFTKDFLTRHGIPTARYRTFTDAAEAEDYVRTEFASAERSSAVRTEFASDEQGVRLVVKADGLAAGKGVVVAGTVDEAVDAVRSMLSGDAFGVAGRRVVVEEFLEGEEASFICLCDGVRALPLATSQDHKARDEGDRGPNTGGMGAYSPAPVVTEAVHERIMQEVIEPTVAGMAADGYPYTGFLYAGLMIAPDGSPKVIEYNCRFGDPEAQPVLMRLKSDLVSLCRRALAGDLSDAVLAWDERVALGVVMAAGGYPGTYRKGDVIEGLDGADAEDLKVFHAGTRMANGDVVTHGGRVLCVVGLGSDVAAAQRRAYAGVEQVRWRDVYYRRDIGHRAIGRPRG